MVHDMATAWDARMSGSHEPRVGIGVPVHNGARYLRAALESILAQSYQNLQVVISDNASTDETGSICERFAAADRRIEYRRLSRNIGAAANFNHCFAAARGKYFKWAAHDDLIDPSFIRRCVDELERSPEAVLCHAQVRMIGPDGRPLSTYDPASLGTSSCDPIRRLRGRLRTSWCKEVFGLIRREALEGSSLIGGYPASDEVLLAELALRGRFIIIPEPLFSNREHDARSTRGARLHHFSIERQRWFAPERAGSKWPTRTLYAAHLGVIRRHVPRRTDRLRCYLYLARSLVSSRLLNLLAEPLIARQPRLMPVVAALTEVLRRLRRRPPTRLAHGRD